MTTAVSLVIASLLYRAEGFRASPVQNSKPADARASFAPLPLRAAAGPGVDAAAQGGRP